MPPLHAERRNGGKLVEQQAVPRAVACLSFYPNRPPRRHGSAAGQVLKHFANKNRCLYEFSPQPD